MDAAGDSGLDGFGHRLGQGVGEEGGPDEGHKDGQQRAEGQDQAFAVPPPEEEQQGGRDDDVIDDIIHWNLL